MKDYVKALRDAAERRDKMEAEKHENTDLKDAFRVFLKLKEKQPDIIRMFGLSMEAERLGFGQAVSGIINNGCICVGDDRIHLGKDRIAVRNNTKTRSRAWISIPFQVRMIQEFTWYLDDTADIRMIKDMLDTAWTGLQKSESRFYQGLDNILEEYNTPEPEESVRHEEGLDL